MSFAWTAETFATAVRLAGERRSAGQIASAIGCPSRSAVIGKLYRAGVTLGGKVDRPPKTPEQLAERRARRNANERARLARLRAEFGPPPPRVRKRATRPASPDQVMAANAEQILPPPPPAAPPGPPDGVDYFTRRSWQCADIISADGEPLRCCGARKRPGSSYCPEHHARYWITPVRSGGSR